jgi:hypothetical protein
VAVLAGSASGEGELGLKGRPTTEIGSAQAAKERALAGLRLMQLREKSREWRRVVVDCPILCPPLA